MTELGSGGRLSDLAYTRILETLFDKQIPAGAFVSQNDLVKLLGIPVAPLRDALRVLEAEGVLTIHPRSGIQFVKPGLELTHATYQFRGILERAAVAVFAETASDELLEDIEVRHLQVIATLGSRSRSLDAQLREELETLEGLLHNAIIGSLNNPLVESSHRRMHTYLRLLRLDRLLTVPIAMRSLREHMDIIQACRARDPDKAVAALSAHFAAALQRHLGFF